MTDVPLLEMRGIVKRYGGTLALREACFDLRRGEIHALVGENGAGKSTLVRVLAAETRADAGSVLLDGRPARGRSPSDALRHGIAVVHQEPKLVPWLSVAENVLLGREPLRRGLSRIDRRALERTTREILTLLGDDLDPRAPVAALGAADRQIVEIARALSVRAKILALDEPTTALTRVETDALFRILDRLRGESVGLILISHRLDEVARVADRITVMRDGSTVWTGDATEIGRAGLIRLMVGRDVAENVPRVSAAPGAEVLRLEEVRAAGVGPISLSLHRGEILGVGGLVGAGRSRLAHALYGDLVPASGRIVLEGRAVSPGSPREALELGIALLPEDRNRQALIPGRPVRENASLSSLASLSVAGVVARRRERAAVSRLVTRLRIRPESIEAPVSSLSGGNRQKVVLARVILARPKVLVFDEPTAGVDVASRAEIYDLLRGLAAEGSAILLISSDLPELLALSHRVAVLRDGALAGLLDAAEASQEAVLRLATGGARG